jgi:hypothetical protein
MYRRELGKVLVCCISNYWGLGWKELLVRLDEALASLGSMLMCLRRTSGSCSRAREAR